MQYGKTTLATDFRAAQMQDWRVRLVEIVLFFIPRANLDHELLYPSVRSWALELSDDLWPVREVALDDLGQPLFRSPNPRNSGFWPDMASQQFQRDDLAPLTAEEFEDLWRRVTDPAVARARWFRYPLATATVIAAIAVALAYVSKLSLWLAVPLVAGAVFVNGMIATLEDDFPGGFNNPDGRQTPRYVKWVRAAGWTIAGIFALLVTLSLCLRFL